MFIDKVFDMIEGLFWATKQGIILWRESEWPRGRNFYLEGRVGLHVSVTNELPDNKSLLNDKLQIRIGSPRCDCEVVLLYTSNELYVAATKPTKQKLLSELWDAVIESVGAEPERAVDTIISALKQNSQIPSPKASQTEKLT